MPNSTDPPRDQRDAAEATALVSAVLVIEQDLSRIVEMIERMIALVETCDDGLVARLASARGKAERGVDLSKHLTKATRAKEH